MSSPAGAYIRFGFSLVKKDLKIYAIVLAAGRSKRAGASKLLFNLDGKSVIKRVVESVRNSCVDDLVVVLGYMADLVGREIPPNARTIVNPDFSNGISSSIKKGLKEVKGRADAAIFVLGDQPMLTAQLVDSLIDRYRTGGAKIVVPTYQGAYRNPILFDKSLFEEIFQLEGDVGAKVLLSRHRNQIAEVPVASDDLFIDIDTEADLKRAREVLKRMKN